MSASQSGIFSCASSSLTMVKTEASTHWDCKDFSFDFVHILAMQGIQSLLFPSVQILTL